jgi:hypothetical protein
MPGCCLRKLQAIRSRPQRGYVYGPQFPSASAPAQDVEQDFAPQLRCTARQCGPALTRRLPSDRVPRVAALRCIFRGSTAPPEAGECVAVALAEGRGAATGNNVRPDGLF